MPKTRILTPEDKSLTILAKDQSLRFKEFKSESQITLPDGKPGFLSMSEDRRTCIFLSTLIYPEIAKERIQIAILYTTSDNITKWKHFQSFVSKTFYNKNAKESGKKNLEIRKENSMRARNLFIQIANSLPENFTKKQAKRCCMKLILMKFDEFKTSFKAKNLDSDPNQGKGISSRIQRKENKKK